MASSPNHPTHSDSLDVYSRLESTIAAKELAPRPNSRAADDVYRHALPEDLNVNEFDYDYNLSTNRYPLSLSEYLPDIYSAVLYHKHLANPRNFASQTNIGCFWADNTNREGELLILSPNVLAYWLMSDKYSCQHPRWNLQVQGSPLSVYMKYDHVRNLTVYVVAHKQHDSSVEALKNLINVGISARIRPDPERQSTMFLEDPFHLHLMLSVLSLEAAKFHIHRFRRFMWMQMNAVDDHLMGLITTDREELSNLTKELQVISQNADSLIASAEVAIISANGIKSAHKRLNQALSNGKVMASGQTADGILYVLGSLKKQKMWLLNYRNRKDSMMNLVYNLVTQQDATNNINIAVDMRRDSASMSAIATLTMVFLPATFTATVLGAGIFSAAVDPDSVHVSNLWWFWIATTVPLTAIVMSLWWVWHKYTMRSLRVTKRSL
ncbi:hypothetical protein K435DRAFT_659316 [Dendrothele bispora CBS 962.96]|uniref:Cora-domain-containing protein n=1 Tax=Dendrothele bispora (strain CBS 962.96) TaxID=1314807 RepID=A0A4S8MA16_DENBC|nr:hypothetical protein K435DRAFT_659316 [Dendrothele bispora CBS 962.96]